MTILHQVRLLEDGGARLTEDGNRRVLEMAPTRTGFDYWPTFQTEGDFCDVVAFAYGLPECPAGYP